MTVRLAWRCSDEERRQDSSRHKTFLLVFSPNYLIIIINKGARLSWGVQRWRFWEVYLGLFGVSSPFSPELTFLLCVKLHKFIENKLLTFLIITRINAFNLCMRLNRNGIIIIIIIINMTTLLIVITTLLPFNNNMDDLL